MFEIFKTVGDKLERINRFEDGMWMNMVNPSEKEITHVAEEFGIELDMLKAPLDEEERARIENENGVTLILVDIPVGETDQHSLIYSTIPLGIILAKECIITICLKESALIRDFIENRVKSFYTFKKTRFILQILYKNATNYLQYLKHIDKLSNTIEQDLHKSMKNKELIQLLKLEKSLVYFSTSLKANELVLEKMMRLEYIKKYPEDTDLLEDVIVENKQAIEMANIYSSILSGTMDAFASIISNNVNLVMKFLTSVTIVMAIPTMISSFYGMNVDVLPFAHNKYAFLIVLLMTIIISAISVFLLAKRKMF